MWVRRDLSPKTRTTTNNWVKTITWLRTKLILCKTYRKSNISKMGKVKMDQRTTIKTIKETKSGTLKCQKQTIFLRHKSSWWWTTKTETRPVNSMHVLPLPPPRESKIMPRWECSRLSNPMLKWERWWQWRNQGCITLLKQIRWIPNQPDNPIRRRNQMCSNNRTLITSKLSNKWTRMTTFRDKFILIWLLATLIKTQSEYKVKWKDHPTKTMATPQRKVRPCLVVRTTHPTRCTVISSTRPMGHTSKPNNPNKNYQTLFQVRSNRPEIKMHQMLVISNHRP